MQEVWRYLDLRAGNLLIAGLSATPLISSSRPDLIADRSITFAELVGRENVIAALTADSAAASIRESPPEILELKSKTVQDQRNEKEETRNKRLSLGFPLLAAMSK